MSDFTTLEAVAALVHRQWSNWARYMLDNLTEENKDRWRKQIETSYEDLPETQRDSDKAWASLYLFLMDRLDVQVPSTKNKPKHKFNKNTDGLLLADGFEKAFHGVAYRLGWAEPVAVYDRERCLDILQMGGSTYEEALEYFEYNVLGAWVGEQTPIFIDVHVHSARRGV